MKYLFIINPNSGKGKASTFRPIIEKIFSSREEEYFIEETEYEGHAIKIVKEYTSKDTYRVISIGGDGTLNEVVNGLIGTDSSLGSIPAGSGNDFIRSIYPKMDSEELLHKLIDGDEKIIDVSKINDRYFINISSIGFDACVVKQALNFKKLPLITGSLAYLFSVFTTLITFKSQNLKIKIDDVEFYDKPLIMAVGKGKYYGGGIKMLPNADLTDTYLEACLISKISKLTVLKLLSSAVKGKHGQHKKYVTFYKAKEIEIEASKEFVMNIDGELSYNNKVTFKVIPKMLKVIVP